MSTREILTLQLGHYSNFIGTHWWNIQESNFSYDPNDPSEVNHDVLYREGKLQTGQITFTPRLLVVDLKGSLGYLKETGTLYDTTPNDQESTLLWDDQNLEITKQPKSSKTSFIRSLDDQGNSQNENSFPLEEEVETWTDYLLPRFNPRTVNIIKDYQHGNETGKFDIFNYGANLWNTDQFTNHFSDKIRTYVEECDQMQGFQVLLDSTDGFAGLGAFCVQHLRDEYNKSILSFPSIEFGKTNDRISDLYKTINTALCWQHIGENSSLFSPLCCERSNWSEKSDPCKFDHLSYNPQLKYHTGAILATALDTLTMRYRRKEYPNVVLSDLCADLNKLGRKAAATSLSLPFPMEMKKDLIDVLDDYEGSMWTSLTPSCDIPMEENMQSLTLRGIPEERLKRPMQEARKQISKAAYKCSSVHEMMTFYLACTYNSSATYLATLDSKLKIRNPYPKIFNNNITENGDIANWPMGNEIQSVPVMAGLHSGNTLSTMYESLYDQLTRIKNIKKFHAFGDSGLENDEFIDCLHHLIDCKESYENHYV